MPSNVVACSQNASDHSFARCFHGVMSESQHILPLSFVVVCGVDFCE